jgi:phage tail sheath gpL-like
MPEKTRLVRGKPMGIDKQSDVAANIQIGPTSMGMVRLYVEGEGVDLPLDFDPDEADEIAEELRAAAAAARALGNGQGKKKR